MLKLKPTGLSFRKAELGSDVTVQSPIFESEDGDYYMKSYFVEMDVTYTGYYRILTPLIMGSIHKMRWHNPPLLSSDVEIVDEL